MECGVGLFLYFYFNNIFLVYNNVMGNIIKVQKGTKDILPQEMDLWKKMH